MPGKLSRGKVERERARTPVRNRPRDRLGGASAPQLLQILDHGNVESARVAGEVRRRRAARDGEERVEANARNGARRSRAWPDAALDEADVRALGRASRKTLLAQSSFENI